MNTPQVMALGRQMLNDHGLSHVPFVMDRGKRRIGATFFHNGEVVRISFSAHFAALLSESEIRNTILHEIAHARAGHAAGHGPLWKSHARALGIKPERCSATEARPDTAWEGRCAAGHKTAGQHRAPLRVRSCGQCMPGRFSADHMIEWYKNGSKVAVSAMPQRYRQEHSAIKLKYMLVKS